MEQIQNMVLGMLQELTTPKAPAKDDKADGNFKDLMEQYGQSAKDKVEEPKPEQAEETPKAENPQEAKPGEEPSDDQWREQMVLAAMTMVQVPVNQVVPVEEQPIQAADQVVGMAGVVETVAEIPQEEGAVLDQSMLQNGEPEEQALQSDTQQLQPVQEQTEVSVEEAPKLQRKVEGPELQQEGQKDQEMEIQVVEDPRSSVFGEVEAAPVKVGETSRPMESQETGDVEKQIMEPLAKALERGDSKVEIQLTPENLGTVKVELTRHADGSLQVVLQAENPHTQSLLDRHAADLQGALHQQNQEPVKVVVQHQEESQHNENYQDENGRQGHQQEQRRQEQKRDSRDFMHQLRLGLTPVE